MESHFDDRDFEHFIKQSADQYRMFPSDNAWKAIHSSVHSRRKWYGIGLGLLLLLTASTVTWVMVSYPAGKEQKTATLEKSGFTTPENTAKTNTKIAPSSSPIPGVINTQGLIAERQHSIQVLDQFGQTVQPTTNNPTNKKLLLASADQLSQYLGVPVNTMDDIAVPPATVTNSSSVTESKKEPKNNIATAVAKTVPRAVENPTTSVSVAKEVSTVENPATPATHTSVFYPETIESVADAYVQKKVLKRNLTWQVYFTPNVSYRKLSLNKNYDGLSQLTSSPTASNYPVPTNINNSVVHKPDLGLELGVSAAYPLTNHLKLKGGLQFNISRYDIKAFVFSTEMATIDLTGTNNTVSTWTNYRNYGGYKSDWLKNYYLSLSVPIGAELTFGGGHSKMQFGVAGTVQPTVILKDRAYLISSDFKNYAEVPWLVRPVNVNTSFETFVSYVAGKARWQMDHRSVTRSCQVSRVNTRLKKTCLILVLKSV